MVLLERFHLNLLHALAAESRSATELSNEMTRRRRLEREIARIADEERRRLGQDIHDGVCQLLTGALLRCQAMERRLDRGAALAPSDLSELSSVLEEGIDEAHAVAKGLCPLEPEPGALVQALRTLAKRTSGPVDVLCEFITSGDTAVTDPSTADHLYRIAQEAVSNAVRHAKAGRITLELRGCEDALVLRVQDNGVGLSSDIPPGGMGLGTMAYRAQAMGGDIRVERAPVGGTRAICRVPRVTHAQTRERQRHSVEGNDGA
jgi:signal transduction histidine kinase